MIAILIEYLALPTQNPPLNATDADASAGQEDGTGTGSSAAG